VAKVYLGDYYEYEVGTGITRSYYGSGSAMRVAGASDPEANGVFYLLKDHLGSTNLTIDSAGNVVGEMRYKAWGETRYTSGTTPTDFNYTSQRQEPDLGFYYYRARWYDPALGRFMQADTIVPHPGSPQSLDRYAYVLNNPLKYFDPSGHQDEDDPPWDPFGWLKDIYRGFSNWWNGLMRDMCSMNLDPNCGMMLPSLPSAPDAIEQVASNYADHSWGGISQEQIEQIHAISDATSRLIVIQEILGPWKVNEVGEPFPVVIDPRTGKPIPPPPDDLQVVPEELRVSWDGRQDRREYIEEWYDQGYETPPGGWDLYQIHHIKPIRYGGTNEFDNLVPVLIEDHRGSGGFNAWWNNYRSSR
jgi:RHS repeat-associated protein